jgi:hypothetical protein
MPYAIGAGLALAVCGLGSAVRLDRDRGFYTTVTMVIATYYVLFAVMGGSMQALAVESGIAIVFCAGAIVGFRRGMWIVAGLLCAHGALDFFLHEALVVNPGMPSWWPPFCGAFDVTAGAYLGLLLRLRSATTTGNAR